MSSPLLISIGIIQVFLPTPSSSSFYSLQNRVCWEGLWDWERRHLTVKAFHSSLITYWAFAHSESVKQMVVVVGGGSGLEEPAQRVICLHLRWRASGSDDQLPRRFGLLTAFEWVKEREILVERREGLVLDGKPLPSLVELSLLYITGSEPS